MANETRDAEQMRPREAAASGAKADQPGSARPRRAYVAPKLQPLGKVADLTFKSGSQSESAHTSKPGH